MPRVGRPAPRFRLTDTAGKKRTLTEFRRRRVALFVFCGCSWCADVARHWGEAQCDGALLAAGAATPGSSPPLTLVVGSHLDAKGCRSLGARARLDPAQTVLLPDPEGTVAELYHADPCPRVYVVGEDGTLLYVNRGKTDAPRRASAAAIVARALQALRVRRQEARATYGLDDIVTPTDPPRTGGGALRQLRDP